MHAIWRRAGEDLKKMMAEHNLVAVVDHNNDGISLDVQYLKQAEHFMRTSNFKAAIKYTHKSLEINPEYTVSNKKFFIFMNLISKGAQ